MFYDYTGIRVRKDSPSGITYFPFSGYEIDSSGIVTKYIKTGTEILAAKKGNDKLFYHNDHLGGVNVITDIWAARVQLVEYDPWGKVSREEGSGDPARRFNGKMLDPESGLYYYGGRYYDPELGRFISPDPFIGQPDDPQNHNRYSYVVNNPVNNIDPSGYFHQVHKKKKHGFFGSIFGAILGFAFGGPIGALVGGSLGAASDFVPQVGTALRVLQIIGGIGMMLTGNPAGFFIAASGAMSFGKGQGWQIGSMFMGLAGSAILLSQTFNSPALAEGQGGDGVGRHSDPHRPGFNDPSVNPGDIPLAEEWPVGSGKINSGGGYSSEHPALDLGCDKWECSVKATGTGEVVATRSTGTPGGRDNFVQTRIPGGYQELYSHVLSAPGIHAGVTVNAGQIIGTVDNSGITSGPHVHYELRGRGGFGNFNPCLRLGC